MRAAAALCVNIVLDDIDDLPERCGYRIRSHDSYGQVPGIEIEYSDHVEYVLDKVSLALERLCVDIGY